MPCVVRRATSEDAEAICALHKASIRALCAAVYSARQIEAWIARRTPDSYREALAAETIFVAERGGRVVGFSSIKDAMLLGLYVDPALGRGTGPRLLRAAEEHARTEGIRVLRLQATLNAAPFYQRHGFQADGRVVISRGEAELDVVEMSKDLRAAS
jgi:putative acetyltransferase